MFDGFFAGQTPRLPEMQSRLPDCVRIKSVSPLITTFCTLLREDTSALLPAIRTLPSWVMPTLISAPAAIFAAKEISGEAQKPFKLKKYWSFTVRYIAPVVILVILYFTLIQGQGLS